MGRCWTAHFSQSNQRGIVFAIWRAIRARSFFMLRPCDFLSDIPFAMLRPTGGRMTYSAEISLDNPICILFVIDQSVAMGEKNRGRTRAQCIADALNKTIYTLVINCTKPDGVHDYVHVGVLTYGAQGTLSGFGGGLSGSNVHPISTIASTPLRFEDQSKQEDRDAGGTFEWQSNTPVWIEPVSSGIAPMVGALTKAAEVVADWCKSRPRSYPPTVLHLTDAASADGDPEPIAAALQRVSTQDGPSLLFNLHMAARTDGAVLLPDRDSGLHDQASLLFRMSSILPTHAWRIAKDKGYVTTDKSRGCMFNADSADILNFFECVAPRFWMLRARITPGHLLTGV